MVPNFAEHENNLGSFEKPWLSGLTAGQLNQGIWDGSQVSIFFLKIPRWFLVKPSLETHISVPPQAHGKTPVPHSCPPQAQFPHL